MTRPEQLLRDHDRFPTEKSRRSLLWHTKLRLQFTGWLQYLPTGIVAIAFLAAAVVGWLLGAWPALFWSTLSIGALVLAATVFDVITVKYGVRPSEALPQRNDDLDIFDLIRARRSCHSFQSRALTASDRGELLHAAYEHTRPNRLIGTHPIRLEYVAAPMRIWPGSGAQEFLVAIAPRHYDRLTLIDVGRSLHTVVLYATRLGIATCWIGPGADHSSVIEHLGDRFDPDRDHVVCLCAVGYRSWFTPLFVRVMERFTHHRLPLSALFFADPHCQLPLAVQVAPFATFGRCYEACQWSPSSYNAQTTRCAAITAPVGTASKVVRFDFYTTTTSRFYAPVALGIWCANWEAGCRGLGIPGHFAVIPGESGDHCDITERPHYGVSWIAERR
ncbi:nitroreductase family protein [Nocardia sp. CNY236]|uniref:nitroreductase family protein n=1 Tax=Nocardia sp. CNY236 TaxID=1169152 RepID=UPI00040AA728|nr:nitroreductase family protein [Nocardia sp. CNY236]